MHTMYYIVILFPLFTSNKMGNIFKRTRSVKRINRNNVFKTVRMKID